MAIIDKIDRGLTTATSVAVVTMVIAMVIITSAAVVFRYFVNSPISWSEEVAKYLMVWVTFLAGSIAARRGAHVSIDIVQLVLPPKARRVCEWLAFVGAVAFLSILLVWGTGFAWGVREHSNPIIGGMSMAWPYAAVPVGALLMLVQFSLAFFRREANRPTDGAAH